MMNKSNCVMVASFPKSGWNWTGDIVTYSVVKHLTGKFEVTYKDGETLKTSEVKPYRLFWPADSRATQAKKLSRLFPDLSLDYCLHSHAAWKYAPLWGLDEAKTVFVTRNIPTMMFSYYKSRGDKYASLDECIIDDKLLDRCIGFYNSWGEFCTRHKQHRIFRFEDYKAKPLATFAELIDYIFGLTVPRQIIQEALDYYSIEKQKEREFKFNPDEKKHFHFKGASDYSKDIPEKSLQYIYGRLDRELVHQFGYEYPKPE